MKIKKLAAMAMAVVLLALTAFTGCHKNGGVALKELQTDGEYEYAKAMWDSSFSEAMKSLPFSIVKDEVRYVPGKEKSYMPAKSIDPIKVEGHDAKVSLEFYKEELKLIQFVFQFEEGGAEDIPAFFDATVGKLKELYGPETKKTENKGDTFETTGYHWETDSTALRISMSKSGVIDGGTNFQYIVNMSISDLCLLEEEYREIVRNLSK